MSSFTKIDITCPDCKKSSPFIKWNSINTMLNPEMKAKVRSLEAFTFTCPHCQTPSYVEHDCLYHQMEDNYMLYYTPDNKAAILKEIANLRITMKNTNVAKDQPDKMNEPYTIRVVENKIAFLEKLIILDAGLDDRIIELQKIYLALHLKSDNPDLHINNLKFNNLDGELVFQLPFKKGKTAIVKFDRSEYEQIAREYVDLLKADEDEAEINTVWAGNKVIEFTEFDR